MYKLHPYSGHQSRELLPRYYNRIIQKFKFVVESVELNLGGTKEKYTKDGRQL
jgi:hypothetical protein